MRIISGNLKRLPIKTLSRSKAGPRLRPTSNYSKQLLFNLLKSNKFISREIEGCVVMDGFAGTGAVGIEFFSRGASHITFVDCEPLNIKQLKHQTIELGISCDIIRTFLPDTKKIKSKFDIIFLDPPYTDGKGKIVQTVKNLLNNLAEDGLIILETVTGKKNKEEMQKHLQKKGVISKLIHEKEASSKTCFLFFKNNISQVELDSI
jgi:16S rRNA (guanine966-N2)-methyltransferase